MISWRNPDARHADWGLDTYVQAVLDALDAVERITGTERTVAGRRLLRRHHRQPGRRPTWPPPAGRTGWPASACWSPCSTTPGPGSPAALVDRRAGRRGDGDVEAPRLPRRPGAGRGVRLAAPRRPGLELLGQQLPARQEAAGVRHPVLERRHHPDAGAAARRLRRHRDGQPAGRTRRASPSSGTPVDLSPVDVDAYVVGRDRRPHHALAELLPQHPAARRRDPVRAVHQRAHRGAGQPAGQPQGHYQINKDNPADPQEWLHGRATPHQGSWWPDFAAWLGERCGGQKPGTAPSSAAAASRRSSSPRHLRLRQLRGDHMHVRQHRPLAGHRLLPHRRPAHRRGARLLAPHPGFRRRRGAAGHQRLLGARRVPVAADQEAGRARASSATASRATAARR